MLYRVIFPPPNSLFITVMSMASLSFSVLGLFEGLGKNFEHSKFSNFNVEKSTSKRNNAVCSKNGMLAAYIPAFLSAVTFSGLFPNVGLRFLLVNSALTIHFFKKILEVLFVHKYSGGMPVDTDYYHSWLFHNYLDHDLRSKPNTRISRATSGFEVSWRCVIFGGIVGNFYHHLLLASPRTKIDKGYKVPKGGLFCLVACPHYFFEILSFLGICFISQTLYSFASTISTICYLMGRSYATRRWYLAKFDDFPKDVKAIIPYVF